MKASKQTNHRHRLNHYYKYLIQKTDSQDPLNFFKIMPVQSPSASPKKKRLQDNRTISYSEKKSARYLGKQSSRMDIEEPSPRVKLPPINHRKEGLKHSQVLQRQESGIDWEKYYNVHHLETVNIDQSTIKLIEDNQRKSKIRKIMSMVDGKTID